MLRSRFVALLGVCCGCWYIVAPPAFAQHSADQPAILGSITVRAENGEGSGDALRKAAQNPVAGMISVPLQNNANFGNEPGSRTQNVLNIQPVIPASLSSDLNLIIRWVTPVVWQPLPAPSPAPEVGVYGFGDMQPSFFFSPRKASKLIWGAGPVFQLPTATDSRLGQGKVGAGPTIVGLTQPGSWTVGALVNNVWSVAGSGSRPDVNQMTLQYFINYNLKKGWYLASQPIVTANWEKGNGDRWVVPFGGGFGRVMRFGMQPVNVQLGFYGNAIHPADASSWSMRATVVFLFPKNR